MAVFELDETQLAAIAPAGGRKAAPSTLLAEVEAAVASPDKAYGIPVAEGVKPSFIVSELHKAAASLGVKVKVWNRATATETAPFVGFKIKPPVVETEAVDAPAPETIDSAK